MKIVSEIGLLQELIGSFKKEGKTVGFVPTMGYLHEGHLSLVDRATKENDIVVMSIFVNPLQFGPNEDFDKYPRDFDRDKQLAENANVDILFFPQVADMYPSESAMKIAVTQGVDVLCGKSRPGHFDGVATVVLKLFNIVTPERAYFGMKDAQQVAVIEMLVRDFNLAVEVVPCDTLREEDGLAKSSRNVNLTTTERKEAPVIYKSLLQAKDMIRQGESNTETVVQSIITSIVDVTSGELDYVQVLTYPELQQITQLKGRIIIAVALKYSSARLIDNLTFDV
ncbi:pantoate--beta-alanine ligase [Bacillus sp. FJAT-45350]|uniref:pantoate--beta-alanine ligase n=1 Tax=Bacillus sp. FJAT-45350 TaxID=2011014 RepID=UPI000BB96740|nr:pantoate--beta-alanine ligase [Bacillus sp. FJAT-45350]